LKDNRRAVATKSCLKNFYARAGKKEGGRSDSDESSDSKSWGEGIFARPRFSAAAEFRASKVGTPPIYF